MQQTRQLGLWFISSMFRWLVLAVLGGGLVWAGGSVAPAQAEFRFSSQRSLSAPDPFLKRRKKPISITAASRLGPVLQQVPSSREPGFRVPPSIVWGRFDPRLVVLLRTIENHFGAKAVISSGCRSEAHNRRVGGARHSFHLTCMAADISIPGIATAQIRDFAMALPGRGGVGTYCSTPIVHVDVGPRRQWYWGCSRIARGFSAFDLN